MTPPPMTATSRGLNCFMGYHAPKRKLVYGS
jgi:hypothetical protein